MRSNPKNAMIQALEKRTLLCGAPPDPALLGRFATIDAGTSGSSENSGGLIVWDNEGSIGNDSDFFRQVFGNDTDAELAREVVRGVIRAFENTITNFNYAQTPNPPPDNLFHLHLEMGAPGFGAGSGITTLWGGKPKSGFVVVGGGNTTPQRGWYLDDNPDDYAEFNGTFVNAFAAEAISGAAHDRPDFYSTVVHEVAHTLGMGTTAMWNARGTNTNIADNIRGVGNFWTFSGPSVQHLMTSFNGGVNSDAPVHTADAGANINFNNINWRGATDLGNAGLAVGARFLIPDSLSLMFRDAYGYTTTNANLRPTFHAVHNPDARTLLIRGGFNGSNSDDVITIGRSGSMISVSVDVGNDVPGTGALPGAGNLPAYTSFFDSSQVSTITIRGLDGDDTININGVFSGHQVDVLGAFGNDQIHLTPAGNNLDLISGTLRIFGDSDNDNLFIHDTSNGFNDTFNITSTSFNRTIVPQMTLSGLETMRMDAGGGNNTFNVASQNSGTSIGINAGGGDDVVNVGGAGSGNVETVDGTVNFNGEAGFDTFNYNDALNTANGQTYTLTSLAATRTNSGISTFANTETININAGSGANTLNVNSTAAGSSTTINANGGADTINLDLSAATLLTVNGGDADDIINVNNAAGLSNFVILHGNAGSGDTLNYNDQTRITNDNYTISSAALERAGAVQSFHFTFENVVINAGTGNDRFDVETTAAGTTYTVNAGAGNDVMDVTFTAGNLGNADGLIVFNGDVGADGAQLWDNLSTANDNYTVSGTQITRSGFGGFSYSTTVEGVAVNASAGSNVINVNSSSVATPLNLNAGNGTDAFNIATGDIDNQILGNVTLNGGIGSELVFFNDITDAIGFDTYTIEANSLRKLSGGTVTWTQVETVQVNGSNNSDLYIVLGSTAGVSLVIDANNGNDQFQLGVVGTGNLNSLAGPLTLNGLGGSGDTVVVHDSGSTFSDNYTLTATTLSHPNFGGMTYSGMEGMTLNASGGANVIDISTAVLCPVTVNAANGTDAINVNETAASAPVTIVPSNGSDTVRVNPDATGSATAIFNATQRIGSLQVSSGGSAALSAGGSKVLIASSVQISGTGWLDLNDNDMIVDYTAASPLNAIAVYVASGYHAGAWDWPGIRSASAVASGNTGIGIAEATDLFSTFPATFAGRSIDNTSILLKHTFYGDTNLDGQVNLTDFNRLAANFGLSSRRWIHGDSDYNGTVNLPDFNRLAGNFGSAAAAPDATREGDRDPEVSDDPGLAEIAALLA